MIPKAAATEEVLNRNPLPKGFNKKKLTISYPVVNNKNLLEIQNFSRKQCLSKDEWPVIDKINSWMISAETATFMKWGGLGVIATELPEAFNKNFEKNGEKLLVVTPLYLGDTGKKKCHLKDDVYTGAEGNSVKLEKAKTITVPFFNDKHVLTKYKVDVYKGRFGTADYLFLSSDRFFSINPHKENPSAQDGCYVYNEFGINEVERFAFFSKAVFTLLKELCYKIDEKIQKPNVLIANDWHSGALAGLTKYFTTALSEHGQMPEELAAKVKSIPIIHLAHHLGYQGWDYENTSKILNSLYEDMVMTVFKNAKAIKNSNPRATNVLIVHDCYNQASSNFHLADRVVTVSKNYLEEVSKELGFGFDFRDILKMRKDHRNFFGIVNGYDKKLISPNKAKIEGINKYFDGFDFKVFDENSLSTKLHNKVEFIKLLSRLATDKEYKNKTIPLVETYKFEDISDAIKKADKIPVFCATSRLAEQKGYDIAAQAILSFLTKHHDAKKEYPIMILGGAGDAAYYEILKQLKDKVSAMDKKAGKRIFVFRGYRDEFAYAIQLASDFYMMPCRFEPCGLTQMEAMAKGTLPIAMSTGGLVDTIDDCVDGFRTKVFFVQDRRVYGNNMTAKRLKNNVNAYVESLSKALDVFYNHPSKIKEMMQKAMKKDFSWDVPNGSVFKYHNLLKTGRI